MAKELLSMSVKQIKVNLLLTTFAKQPLPLTVVHTFFPFLSYTPCLCGSCWRSKSNIQVSFKSVSAAFVLSLSSRYFGIKARHASTPFLPACSATWGGFLLVSTFSNHSLTLLFKPHYGGNTGTLVITPKVSKHQIRFWENCRFRDRESIENLHLRLQISFPSMWSKYMFWWRIWFSKNASCELPIRKLVGVIKVKFPRGLSVFMSTEKEDLGPRTRVLQSSHPGLVGPSVGTRSPGGQSLHSTAGTELQAEEEKLKNVD